MPATTASLPANRFASNRGDEETEKEMETVTYEFARRIPVIAETEVLVVGGGPGIFPVISGGHFSGIIDAAA